VVVRLGEKASCTGINTAALGPLQTIAGLFRERIAPGAFTATIARDDVRALFNHNPDAVLGPHNGADGDIVGRREGPALHRATERG
jgi:Caudovirus prohead serine protease